MAQNELYEMIFELNFEYVRIYVTGYWHFSGWEQHMQRDGRKKRQDVSGELLAALYLLTVK